MVDDKKARMLLCLCVSVIILFLLFQAVPLGICILYFAICYLYLAVIVVWRIGYEVELLIYYCIQAL